MNNASSPLVSDPTIAPAADAPVAAVETRHATTLVQIVNLLAVVIPLAGVIVAMILLWGRGFSALHLGLLLAMHVLTGIGVTVGYHRLFTHRSFETVRPIRAALAVLGSMAVEGPLFQWVATHRRHHQHSDEAHDPHSPHLHGEGLWGMMQGLWHAHVGWLFTGEPAGTARYVGDLRKEPMLRRINSLFVFWVFLGLLIPTLIGGLVTGTWMGAFLGFLWGGLVRIFLVHHITWSINSVCHFWGARPFETGDESRNNVVFGILAMGEGWHNNHHAFPTSARHGLRWWQLDMSYLLILLLSRLGLAWKVRTPSPEAIAAKQAH